MGSKALIIIDVQVVMFTYKIPLYRSDDVIACIQKLLYEARKIGLPVIYIQHTEHDPESVMAEGAPGWQIDSRIAPREGEIVVQKNLWDAFHETALEQVLKEQDIDTLYITGMQSDYCVDTTCRSAHTKGYQCVLVSDAQSTFDTPVLSAKQIIDHHLYVLSGIADIQSTEEVLKTAFGEKN